MNEPIHTTPNWITKHGVIGGIIAGLAFAVVEMLAALIMTGNMFGPLKMIASVPLMREPMQIDLMTAIVVGVISHLLYSIIVAIIIAYVVANTRALITSKGAIILFTTVVGFLMWPINFYLLAPVLGLPWFATQTVPWQQFLWHTFFFGTVLGLYLSAKAEPAKRVA